MPAAAVQYAQATHATRFRSVALASHALEAFVMDTMLERTSFHSDREVEVGIYWKACAAIRHGEVAAGVADLLPLAWARSPVLRSIVRTELARHGAMIH